MSRPPPLPEDYLAQFRKPTGTAKPALTAADLSWKEFPWKRTAKRLGDAIAVAIFTCAILLFMPLNLVLLTGAILVAGTMISKAITTAGRR